MKGLPFKIKEEHEYVPGERLIRENALQPFRIVGEGKVRIKGEARPVFYVASDGHYASLDILIPNTFKSYLGLPLSSYGKDKEFGLIAIYQKDVELLTNKGGSTQLTKLED